MQGTPSWFRQQGDELILDVRIQPRAGRDEINGVFANRLRIRIKSPPVDGKANKHLLEFIARTFGVP